MMADRAEQSLANERTLRRAVLGISSLDIEEMSDCLGEDHIMQLPYEHGVGDLDGTGFCDLLEVMFTQFRQFTVTLTHVYSLAEPDMLVARYQGDSRGRDKDVRYANQYLGLCEFRDGLHTLWREYDNPQTSSAATEALIGTSL
jgi:ketosteroid isomerase-like protein